VLGKITHSLAAITTLQHLAGLVLVALVYAMGLRLGVGRWVAAGVAVVVGLDAWMVVLEQSIMAETAFALLLAIALFLSIGDEEGVWWKAALAGVLIALACTFRAVGVFAIPVWLIYVAWQHRRLAVIAAAVFAVALPLAGYAVETHRVFGSWGLTATGGWFRYGRVAQLADCSRFTPPPGTRGLCETATQRAQHRPVYYLWNPNSPARRMFGDVGSSRRANKLLGEFGSRVIRSDPAGYAGLVLGDFAGYFTPGRSSPAGSDTAIALSTSPRTTPPFFNRAIRDRYEPSYKPAVHPPASALHTYAKVFHMPRWLLALALLASLGQGLLALIPRWRRAFTRTPEVLLLSGSAVLMLLGASASSAFVIRYLVPVAPFLLLGGATAVRDLLSARDLLRAAPARRPDLVGNVGHLASE
jgi:4-amino-4-deoxy-L-arabinose transferase-like glycosyltransferase